MVVCQGPTNLGNKVEQFQISGPLMIPLNLLILELDVKQGKYGCFEAILAPTAGIW